MSNGVPAGRDSVCTPRLATSGGQWYARLLEAGVQPNGSQTIGIGITDEWIIDVRRNEYHTRRSALWTE
jgi:hypothetical protein